MGNKKSILILFIRIIRALIRIIRIVLLTYRPTRFFDFYSGRFGNQ